MRSRSRSSAGGLVVLALTALAMCGCGSSASGGDASSAGTRTKTNAKVAAEVPDGVKAKGMLTVAADATYPPNEFVASDRHTVVGMDPDLARALAGTMGLKVKIVNATFDSILPGLAVAASTTSGCLGFTDTKAREQTVDFVTYFSAGTSFFVDAHRTAPRSRSSPTSAGTGRRSRRARPRPDDATAQAKRCSAAGKAGRERRSSSRTRTAANLALSSGRAEVGMADSPVAAWLVKKSTGRVQGRRRDLRHRSLRGRDPEGDRHGPADSQRDEDRHGERQYRAILQKWGLASRSDRRPDPQQRSSGRRDGLRDRARAPGVP